MSKEFKDETVTVTIVFQHFTGRPTVSTVTVDGIDFPTTLTAVRLALLGLGFADETVNEKFPCES